MLRVSFQLPRYVIALGMVVALPAGCGGSDDGVVATTPPLPAPPPPEWFAPDCTEITGVPVATFSTDGGNTFVPFAEEVIVSETSKLVAVPEHGGLLFAIHSRYESAKVYSSAVYYSTDAGCHWEKYAELPGDGFKELVALGPWGFAGNKSDGRLYRLHADGSREDIGYATGEWLTATPDDPSGLYSLANDHVWRGFRLGRSWGPQGTVIPTPSLPRRFAINPEDQLHMIVTGFGGEAAVTFDGGNSWMASTGIVKDAEVGMTLFPVFGGDEAVEDIWVQAWRHYQHEDGSDTREKYLARSVNGGLDFEDVIRIDQLHPGAMVAPPQRAGEVLIATDYYLYRYRASDNSFNRIDRNQDVIGSFTTLVFHPTNPEVLYAGIRKIGPVSH